MARILENILDAIGNTPMVRLNRLPGTESAEVLVKLEYLNPSGSVKDRSAWGIILDAERTNLLGPDSIIVEASSGNQGISLAMIGAVRGYKVVVFMPETMSSERQKVLEAYGAEVVLTPAGKDMKETFETAKNMAEEFAASNPKAFLTRQFDNEANTRAHVETTAKEILRQTGGRLDAFVSGIGTGGTLAGVGKLLKEAVPGVKVVAVEPYYGSLFHETCKGVHAQEGIGDGMFPGILDDSIIDEAVLVTDDEAIECARRLAREEGIFCGISSGTNVFGALKLARELGPGHTVVTLIPDGGLKYLSTSLCKE
ncbi:MAG: cysteine synthase A [Bacillota bacterium]|nr:cysteine synthase A [Candidatus Fermentithermobacillaceae bacterium]